MKGLIRQKYPQFNRNLYKMIDNRQNKRTFQLIFYFKYQNKKLYESRKKNWKKTHTHTLFLCFG